MADDPHARTEPATPWRRHRAREQGQVALSHDLTTALTVGGGAVGLAWALPALTEALMRGMIGAFQGIALVAPVEDGSTDLTPERVVRLWTQMLWLVASPVLLCLVVAWLVAVMVPLAQTRGLIRGAALLPTWDRVGPQRWISQVWSWQGPIRLALETAKVGVLVAVTLWAMADDLVVFPRLMTMDLGDALGLSMRMVRALVTTLVGALIGLGILDYVVQWIRHERSLRMSKAEIKQEFREREFKPEVKGRQRQLHREWTTNAVLASVAQGTVTVTNPTHYAVVLRFVPEEHPVPVVVAKGDGRLALEIKAVARELGMPVVEHKLVARTLYALVAPGHEIPRALYRAVAEIIVSIQRATAGDRP